MITKVRFIRDTLKEIEVKAAELKSKYGSKINGNAFNKAVKEIETKSYNSDLFFTGEYSEMTLYKDGSKYKLQDSPNWREILKGYCDL